jgi:hypothetical protein
VTVSEIQARGQRTLERLRRANGEYAEMLEGELAWLDALLTTQVLRDARNGASA